MDCQACIAPRGAFFLLKAGVPSVKRVKNRVHRSGVPCFLSDYVRAIPSGTAPAHTQDLRLAGGSAYTPEGRQHTQASLRRGVCTSLLKGGDRVRQPKNAVMGAKNQLQSNTHRVDCSRSIMRITPFGHLALRPDLSTGLPNVLRLSSLYHAAKHLSRTFYRCCK